VSVGSVGIRPEAAGPSGEALETWLNDECLPDWHGVEIVGASRPSGGNSYETWFLDLREEQDPHRELRVVLRREPVRGPVEPYDISLEARVLAGLEGSGVAIPPVLGFCPDGHVAERPFVVLGNVPGEVPDYRTVTSHPDWVDVDQRRDMTEQFLRTLVEIQRVDWRAPSFAGVFDAKASLRPRLIAQIDRQVDIAQERIASGWPPVPAFRDAARWLKRHAPELDADQLVLVHGDYRIGNFIWRDHRLEAMLDWEGVTVGDPMQDLGYTCHNVMRDEAPELMAMLAPKDEYLATYERISGRAVDPQRLHYFVIYALFYHLWTQLIALPSVVEGDAKLRILNVYNKPALTAQHLTAQILSYEEGRGVL
jgi:aminoglycoside phosphotransferase (APT) family kinase protein